MTKLLFFYIVRYFYHIYKECSLFYTTIYKRISNPDCVFYTKSRIDKNTILEGNNSLGEGCLLTNSYMGRGSYIGKGIFPNIKVGRFCSIGSNLSIIQGKHPTSIFVSTHPLFFSGRNICNFKVKTTKKILETSKINNYSVIIGNDVWIGDNVTIMGGVTIEDGSIIGANSLITKNILPYSINIGTPTKILRYRFTEMQISFLLNYKWWNKDINWIKENLDLFENINSFIDQELCKKQK